MKRKNDSSTAYTHAHDMRELFLCNQIQKKPIMLLSNFWEFLHMY